MHSVKELLKKKDTILIDVRSPYEYDQEHLRGARNIPLDEVPERIEEFKKMKGALVLYCRSGNRSGMAVSLLKQNGLQDVYNGGAISDLQYLLN